MTQRPLDGIKVLELGQLLAGPFTGTQLAYFGAEVIKVETPVGGDPIRGWRVVQEGTSLWWYSIGRNKKSITLDLNTEKGRELVLELIKQSDVLIENFRPGKMESWGLGPEDLKKTCPDLIYTRISGYGQTGPYAQQPGFASVTEGFSGFRYLNGFPGDVPVRPNLSLGDTLAGIHAFIGILLALLQRNKTKEGGGQVVDVALYEAMFNTLEAVVPEYDGAGVIRQPSGTTVTGIVPTNTYRCADGKFVIIGGNGDSIFKRLMIAVGANDMAEAPYLADNAGRVKHEQEIDSVLNQWCQSHSSTHILEKLKNAGVPGGPVYNIEDMMHDPHYQARQLFETVAIPGGELKIPAIMPKLEKTPGRSDWAGPTLGQHNEEIYQQRLGLNAEQLINLKQQGVI